MDEAGSGAAAAFVTKQLGEAYDVLAPDTSEIRLLVDTTRGSLAHGTLPPGRVSLAIAHRTVEEVWYVTQGRGRSGASRMVANWSSMSRRERR